MEKRQAGNGSIPRIAVVLSGGGARGAYEAGVLSYLLDDFPAKLGRPACFEIITGTSVGAIHACFLAGSLGQKGAGERLIKIWESLTLEAAFDIGPADAFKIPMRVLGLLGGGDFSNLFKSGMPNRLPGVLDTAGLESVVVDAVDWKRLRHNIDSGSIKALAIAATEIATGRSVVFVDSPEGKVSRWATDRTVIARPARLTATHALASASLPLVFPAVRIKQTYYCDGGLRMNTPLAPALRLGADRVLIIGLRREVTAEEEDKQARRREAAYASPAYLAGKALNALMLDRIEYDIDRMRLFNAILEDGIKAYGEDFVDKINETIVAYRTTPYRIVRDLFLRPSKDLGVMASECLHHKPRSPGVRGWLSRRMAKFAARGVPGEADLLSYLFFDRCFTEHLVELGRKDAKAAEGELLAFFSEGRSGGDKER
ncbi:MAG: patatin-like phospholipase family protein [Myxococcota bacterium]